MFDSEFLSGIPDHVTLTSGINTSTKKGNLLNERHASQQSSQTYQVSTPPDFENIIGQAVESRASDVHFEPFSDSLRIRFRLDGRLTNFAVIPLRFATSLVARIKVAGGLDIAEKRRPQDGRLLLHVETRTIDLRLSVLPTQHGEKVVVRILDQDAIDHELDKIGFAESEYTEVLTALSKRRGMILVTGPTGSGKTTTLYSALSFLAAEEVNICTLEDPVEYELPGINQSRIRSDIGYTFASSLRSILRQDPDVIMIGEIRDAETAEISIRAALTGHLVLSTLHTNDAVSTIARLLDMGIEPYLIASALSMIIAQRLVRRICSACTGDEPRCQVCRGTGFHGRVAVFEVLNITESLANIISTGAAIQEMEAYCAQTQHVTLQTAASRLVSQQLTTATEILEM